MENKQTGVFPFIRAVTDFVFVSDAPEKVDVILIPGSRHPANAIRAAELYCAAMRRMCCRRGGTARRWTSSSA